MGKHGAKARKSARQPVFHKVAENLYRLESSGGYYSLVKRAGKQFRRFLKTKDRKLAERRLGDLKGMVIWGGTTAKSSPKYRAKSKRPERLQSESLHERLKDWSAREMKSGAVS